MYCSHIEMNFEREEGVLTDRDHKLDQESGGVFAIAQGFLHVLVSPDEEQSRGDTKITIYVLLAR